MLRFIGQRFVSTGSWVGTTKPAAGAANTSHNTWVNTNLTNGVNVVVSPNAASAVHLSLIWKSGSAEEKASSNELGLNHVLRRSLGINTTQRTGVAWSRSMQQLGADISAHSNREHLIYRMVLNDPRWIDTAVERLLEGVLDTQFLHWQLGDHTYKYIFRDLEMLRRRLFDENLIELVHKAGYGPTPLGQSVYANSNLFSNYEQPMLGESYKHGSPDTKEGIWRYQSIKEHLYDHLRDLDCYSIEDIHGFTQRNMGSADKLTVSVGGGGLTADDWVQLLDKTRLRTLKPSTTTSDATAADRAKSHFTGGEERFVQRYCDQCKVALVWPTSGVNEGDANNESVKSVLAAALAIKGEFGVISNSVLTNNKDVTVAPINLSYTDSGLVGFILSGKRRDIVDGQALSKGALAGVKILQEGKVPNDLVQFAKNMLRNQLLIQSERPNSDFAESVGELSSLTGSTDIQSILKSLDSVSAESVNQLAKKTFAASNKFGMSAVGDIEGVPFLSELKHLGF